MDITLVPKTFVAIAAVCIGIALTIVFLVLRAERKRLALQNQEDDEIPASPPAPHEQYPEIMHWQEGDEFDPHVDDGDQHYYSLRLIALTADGYAYCNERQLSDRKVKVHLSALVGHNESAVTRMVNDELHRPDGYMELIREFNAAFKELQERDKKLKLVS